jgi:hypothetical protein
MAGTFRKMAVYLGLVEDDLRESEALDYDYETPESAGDVGEDKVEEAAMATKRKVMVIYGHDDEANRALFN